MAEALGVAGSITGIVAFGLKSATIIQTYIDAVNDADQNLQQLVAEVKSTALTLEQLNALIEQDSVVGVSTRDAGDNSGDKGGTKVIRVANDEGVQHAVNLASQCKQAYTAILNLIAKDIGAPQDENGEVCVDNLDPDNIKVPTHRKLKFPFREGRIKKLRKVFKALKLDLLVHLGVLNLATLWIGGPPNSPEAQANLRAKEVELEEVKAEFAEYVERFPQPTTRGSKSSPPHPKRRRKGSMSPTRIREKSPVISRGADALRRDLATSLDVEARSPHDMSIHKHESHTGSRKGKEIYYADPIQPDPVQQKTTTSSQALISFSTLGPVPPGSQSNLTSKTGLPELPHVKDEQPLHDNTESMEKTKSSSLERMKSALSSSIIRKRKKSPIIRDSEIDHLEAYEIEDSRKRRWRKLPFSRHDITRALSDAKKSNEMSALDQYLSLDVNMKDTVDLVRKKVTRSQPWTLVALDRRSSGTSTPTLIVFFVQGSPVEPVHVEYTDQQSEFPYESCLTWDEMKCNIEKEFSTNKDPDFSTAIRSDQYHLIGPNRRPIRPSTWMSHVKPGIVVYLELTMEPKVREPYAEAASDPHSDGHILHSHKVDGFDHRGHYINPHNLPYPSNFTFSHSLSGGSDIRFYATCSFTDREIYSSQLNYEEDIPSQSQSFVPETESDGEDSAEAEDSIIDINAAQSIANLGIDDLLRKWTNVAEVPSSFYADDGGDDTATAAVSK